MNRTDPTADQLHSDGAEVSHGATWFTESTTAAYPRAHGDRLDPLAPAHRDGHAESMIDYQRMFHVGVLTTGLEAAMEDLGEQLGVTWCSIQDRELPVRIAGGEETLVAIRFTYSAEGPQHIELLDGAAGSYWDGTGRPGLHHVGVWVDDLTAETDMLRDAGWALEASGVGADGGYGTFTYLRAPSGQLVELVNSEAKPRFEGWWAGGDM